MFILGLMFLVSSLMVVAMVLIRTYGQKFQHVLLNNTYMSHIEKIATAADIQIQVSKTLILKISSLLLVISGLLVIFQHFLILILIWALTLILPIAYCVNKSRQRIESIRRQFPFFLELCSLCLDSGMDLFHAIDEVTKLHPHHPLSKECSRMLRQIGIGLSRQDALEELGKRCPLDEINHWIIGVCHSLELGTSLAVMLKTQSVEIYSKKKHRIEGHIQKIPVKLLFPLILLVFPLFILIFAPIILQMVSF